jgi:hypothetical protein
MFRLRNVFKPTRRYACVHCPHYIMPYDNAYSYPLTGSVAHLRCVSVVSAERMDILIRYSMIVQRIASLREGAKC